MTTAEKLAKALEEAGAPKAMVASARDGLYDSWRSPLATPIVQLRNRCLSLGMKDLARRVEEGEFDGTKEEMDAWVRSPEGQQAMRTLTKYTRKRK